MKTSLRLGLTLALATSLGAVAQQPKQQPQAADPLISECKTISCLRNLLRGAEGPPGPRGPAGPAGKGAVQDVYAGSFRIGRLIGMDVMAQCGGVYRTSGALPVPYDSNGLVGLIETSTGWLVHLCLGVQYPSSDVGPGATPLTEGDVEFSIQYKTPDCTGQPYTFIREIGSPYLSFAGNGSPESGAYGGVFGKLMGKNRVAVVSSGIFGGQRFSRSFAMTGPVEQVLPRSYGRPFYECVRHPDNFTTPQAMVKLLPNDPSITGLPDAPQTPYHVVDVQ